LTYTKEPSSTRARKRMLEKANMKQKYQYASRQQGIIHTS
jgi:hypothetical protein